MTCVRPTLRALRDLPDSQLPPSVVEVLQRAQREGDRETKYRILSELDLCLLDHPLLDKARTMVTAGRLDKHESSSDALGKPVYEVRLPGGAAWRGALIRDGSTYWLVHVDTHDEFHKSAAKRIGDGAVMPTTLDRNLHERERTRRGVNTERIDAIGVILQSLSNAIEAGHSSSEVLVPGSSESALVRISVEHDHSTESATPTHELAGLLSITVTGTGQAAGLNDLLRRLAIFLQPDPDAIEQGYDEKGGVVLSMLVTHAKLIQVLASPQVPSSAAGQRGEHHQPTTLHYLAEQDISRGVVDGVPGQALCGFWFVPTRDEKANLPICEACDTLMPLASDIAATLRRLDL